MKKKVSTMALAITLMLCIFFTACDTTNLPEVRFRNAIQLADDFKTDEAIAEFNQLIEDEPLYAEGYIGLAYAYIIAGTRADATIEVLLKGHKLTGDARILEMLGLLGWTEEDEAQNSNSSDLFADIMSRFSASVSNKASEETLILGIKYLEEKDYEQAEIQLKKFIELEPTDARGYAGLILVYNDDGSDFDDIIAVLIEGYKMTQHEIFLDILKDMGWSEEDESFASSDTMSSYDGYDLATQYFLDGDYEQAEREFEDLLANDPLFSAAYIGLATVYINDAYDNKGNVSEAIEKSIAVLNEGYELTQDEKILEALNLFKEFQ